MAKIYKITSKETDKVYVGSTEADELRKRMWWHKNNMKAGATTTSKEILKYADAKIELIEECEPENKQAREQYWIDHFGPLCVNQIRAEVKDQVTRSKEYRERVGKEVLHQKDKEWREANAEYNKGRQATYFAENKAELQAKHKARNVPVPCPQCQKMISKYGIPRHINSLHQ